MKFKKEWLKKRWVDYTISLCIVVVFYLCLSHLGTIFHYLGVFNKIISPIVLGVIVAYVLTPVVKYLETKFFKFNNEKVSHFVSIFVTYFLVFLIIALLMISLIPQLARSIMNLIENAQYYADSLTHTLNELAKTEIGQMIDISVITNAGTTLIQKLLEIIPQHTDTVILTASNIGTKMFNLVITFFISLYILIDKDLLLRGFDNLFKNIMTDEHYNKSKAFWSKCHHILLKFIGCDLLDGLIVGVANFIFMVIMNYPFGLLLSVIVGVTNLAPTFGPIVGCIIGGFLLLLINPIYAFWFVIFTIVLQTIDGYILKPKLFGDSFGVPSLWILVSIIVFGRLFGVWGILLAIPLAAIIDNLYRDYFIPYLQKRKRRRA